MPYQIFKRYKIYSIYTFCTCLQVYQKTIEWNIREVSMKYPYIMEHHETPMTGMANNDFTWRLADAFLGPHKAVLAAGTRMPILHDEAR